MSSLENWLEDRTSDVKRREEAGFPEDVDAEIKWNKVSLAHSFILCVCFFVEFSGGLKRHVILLLRIRRIP